MVDVSRGEGRLMSSQASRTAAMIDAAITTVEAKRSSIRCCSSRAVARRISPIRASLHQGIIIGEENTKIEVVAMWGNHLGFLARITLIGFGSGMSLILSRFELAHESTFGLRAYHIMVWIVISFNTEQ
jgi:hypothetical protein